MDEALLERISSSLLVLPDAEAKLARYILQNSQAVTRMSVGELAQASGVSVATIVRFARRMKTAGFADFKIRLSGAIASQQEPQEGVSSINPDDKPGEIFNKVCSYLVISVQDTRQLLDRESFARAVDLLYSLRTGDGKVYIFGVGATAPLAEQAAFEFSHIGLHVVHFHDTYLALESMSSGMCEKDVLLCLSTLGRSSATRAVMSIARRCGAEVILISQYGCIKNLELDIIALLTANIESDSQLLNATALMTESSIIHALFLCLIARDYDNILGTTTRMRDELHDLGF